MTVTVNTHQSTVHILTGHVTFNFTVTVSSLPYIFSSPFTVSSQHQFYERQYCRPKTTTKKQRNKEKTWFSNDLIYHQHKSLGPKVLSVLQLPGHSSSKGPSEYHLLIGVVSYYWYWYYKTNMVNKYHLRLCFAPPNLVDPFLSTVLFSMRAERSCPTLQFAVQPSKVGKRVGHWVLDSLTICPWSMYGRSLTHFISSLGGEPAMRS